MDTLIIVFTYFYLQWQRAVMLWLLEGKSHLASDRQHLSYDICLEVGGEISRTVLCCIVYWSCAQFISTLGWAVLTVLWIGFCHTGPISQCVDLFVSIFVYVFCVCFFHTAYLLLCYCEHGGEDLMGLKP